MKNKKSQTRLPTAFIGGLMRNAILRVEVCSQ